MKKLDLVLAWALVVLGLLQYGGSLGILNVIGFWSLAGGTAILGTGFLNVVRNERSRGVAKIGSVVSNVALTIAMLAILVPLVRHGHVIQHFLVIVGLSLTVPETLFSIFS